MFIGVPAYRSPQRAAAWASRTRSGALPAAGVGIWPVSGVSGRNPLAHEHEPVERKPSTSRFGAADDALCSCTPSTAAV